MKFINLNFIFKPVAGNAVSKVPSLLSITPNSLADPGPVITAEFKSKEYLSVVPHAGHVTFVV